jgi:hypothetical protein
VIALKPHLEQTAERYKLKDWVDTPEDRRKKYFFGIEGFKTLVRGMTEQDPAEDQIVNFLMQTIEKDGTFTRHIKQWKNGAKLVEESFWAQLFETGATLLLAAYVNACDQEEWPE